MRTLHWLVLGETIALAVVVLMWLLRGESSAATTAELAASETMQGEAKGPIAARVEAIQRDARVPEVVPPSVDDASNGLVLVSGTVRDEQGQPVAGASLWFVHLDQERSLASGANGAYAAPALRAGTWELICTADGFADLRRTLSLDARPRQRIDLVLRRWTSVLVKIDSATSEPLAVGDALLATSRSVTVVATKEPLDRDLPAFDQYGIDRIGVGQYETIAESGIDRAAELQKSGFAGVLHLGEDPPLFAALYFGHLWLQTQPIAMGQNEVVFHVPPNALASRMGGLKVRFLDSETKAPVIAAHVMLRTGQHSHPPRAADAEGRVSFEPALPGIGILVIDGTGREELELEVRIPSGEILDLGDLPLSPRVAVEGLIVDAAGVPVPGARMTYLDLDRAPKQELSSIREVSSDVEGKFTLSGLGRRRYAVTARREEQHGRVVFDARNGSPPPLRIQLETWSAVAFHRSGDPLRGYIVSALDANGQRVGVASVGGASWHRHLSLPRGPHTIEIRGEDGALVRSFALVVGEGPQVIDVP